MKKIYLDYAAATPLDPRVLEAMRPFFSKRFHNPSASYLSARTVRDDLLAARSNVASVLGCRPAEIVFTAGATEANNLAIQGIMRQYPNGEILTSSVEHDSVMAPAELFTHKQVPVNDSGTVKLNKLSNLISDRTVLVSVMLVNNELGTIQPLAQISSEIQAVRKLRRVSGNDTPLYLHTDAAQAGNYLDMHTSRLGVDLLSLNGGKIYGPKQSGALYVKAGVELSPLILGGGQEFGRRSGTESLANTAGLAKALELAAASRRSESKRINDLRLNFEKRLAKELTGTSLNGSSHSRAPHIISATFKGADNERLMMELDEQGVECAVGSACSASSGEPSPVLAAIGMNTQQIRSTLRFSLGKSTTTADIEKTVGLIKVLTATNR